MITRLILLFVALLAPARAATESAGPVSAPVVYYYLNGKKTPEFSPVLRYLTPASSIIFQVGDASSQSGAKALRARYKMEGVNTDWIQKQGEMALIVMFYNVGGDQIHQDVFAVKGASPGWRNTVERSTFTSRSAALTVPAEAATIGFCMSSAGPPASIGVFVLKNLQATRMPSPPKIPEMILEGSPSMADDTEAFSTRRSWMPDGTSPSMAKVIDVNEAGKTSRAFQIIDDDIKGHAEWRTPRDKRHEVTPGDKIVLEWEELFDIGVGDESYVTYGKLLPGRHRFIAETVDLYGKPQGVITSVEIQVPRPLWENPYVWLLSITGASIAILVTNRYIIGAKLRRHLRQAQLLDQERQRIARDLHDDLGSRLTHISLLSAHARTNKDPSSIDANFNEISHLTRDLVMTLSETVWMLNGKNDNLEALINFLCQLIPAQCKPAQIRCRIDALTVKEDHPISSAIRHNITLSVKEILNNIVRHAEASEIHTQMRYVESVLKISISDNGRGFPETAAGGNGLANIKGRIAAIGGKIEVHSHVGKGTLVAFEVRIA